MSFDHGYVMQKYLELSEDEQSEAERDMGMLWATLISPFEGISENENANGETRQSSSALPAQPLGAPSNASKKSHKDTSVLTFFQFYLKSNCRRSNHRNGNFFPDHM